MSDLDSAKARIRELESQLIEVRHNYQRLQDETQWGEGNLSLCGHTMQVRFRGQLFLSPVEPEIEPFMVSCHVPDRDDRGALEDFVPDRGDRGH